jgi:hypothetical protein
LRSPGLLDAAEALFRRLSMADDDRDNENFCREHPDFVPPPLAAVHDAYATISFRSYWAVGQYMAQLLADLIQPHHPMPRRILEWGCGSVRILRHLPSLMPGDTEFFGTD